jgi:hypothetical protein
MKTKQMACPRDVRVFDISNPQHAVLAITVELPGIVILP